MTTHTERREKARTYNKQPTLTDQSAAAETDINVIVPRLTKTGGVAIGNAQEPMYGDFSDLPQDLRGFLDARNSLEHHRLQLPPELRDIPTDELVYMTPEALAKKLKPATPPKPEEKPT